MIIDIDEQIRFQVSFDPADRETGFEDDIRFSIVETGSAELRLFGADETSILLTPTQAEQLAAALLEAARLSRATPLA
ncbi:MAG: hypothetical protein NT169_13560 [Chloroflexi bacterium]|nr:hypothetical protein [Chloroflexota bacterium]